MTGALQIGRDGQFGIVKGLWLSYTFRRQSMTGATRPRGLGARGAEVTNGE
jgi:hypothetical protein